jgi:hypothetical protein
MSIVGSHPESGIRLVLEHTGGPPWVYRGAAFTPSQRFVVRAVVDAKGAVRVEVDGAPPTDLPLRIRSMIRAVYKHAQADDPRAGPPRRLQRWRA